MVTNKSAIKVLIPSELGYEKVAMSVVAVTAQKIGFPEDKIEDLKTAVAEACTNAIEHGNALNQNAQIELILVRTEQGIRINIIDEGHQLMPTSIPDRADRNDFRGLGLYLMQALTDELEIKSEPGRNEIQLTSYLPS